MFEQLKDIYNSLGDEESKMTFRCRLLYSLTHDWKYIKELLGFYKKENKEYLDILDVFENPHKYRGRKIVLFGTGFFADIVMKWLDKCNLEVQFFCDNDSQKWGEEFAGRRIISPEELFREYRDALVFIATERYQEAVLMQLTENAYPNEQIIRLMDLPNLEEVYFPKGIFYPEEQEIYIDGGCYDGDSSLDFIEWAGKENIKKIYAFEPDPDNYIECKKNLNEKCEVDCEVLQYGLWSEKGTVSFVTELGASSHFDNNGENKINVINIDEVVGDEKVTFIKMDIEGSELEALKGAARTIQKNKPRLAICLYHKDEDIVDIPQYVKELVPEYKLYIRHYSASALETVLYAVI